MNYFIIFLVVFELILENYLFVADVGSDILNYYKSDAVSNFHKRWEQHRKSYENALKVALRESFGKKAMNTIERKMEGDCKLSNGFYVNDNIVHVFFQDMYLTELPHLKEPEIIFPLAHNVLSVEAELGKMIIETEYSMMRNTSDVLSTGVQDSNNNSPFVLQQIQNEGQLAIIAEGCSVSGFTIARLIGLTISLGHETFGIENCKFSLEILGAGSGSPPVIAPYFSKAQASLLENILSKPIRKELMTKLRSAVFTYVNTSIFEDEMPKYRREQENIFKEASNYINKYVRDTNKANIMKERKSHDLAPLEIFWTVEQRGITSDESVVLKDFILDGFDTIYSPQIGGPYKLKTVGIADTLRYNTLKIYGKFIFERDNIKNEHGCYMELQDVTLNMNLDLEDTSQTTFNIDKYFYWRNTDFSIINLEHTRERIIAESIVRGYVTNEVSKYLTRKMSKALDHDDPVKSEDVSDGKASEENYGQSDVKSMDNSDLSAPIGENVGTNDSEDKVEFEAVLNDQNLNTGSVEKIKKNISPEEVISLEAARRIIKILPNPKKNQGFLSRSSKRQTKKTNKGTKKKNYHNNIKYEKIKKHYRVKHPNANKNRKIKKGPLKIKRRNQKTSGMPMLYDNKI